RCPRRSARSCARWSSASASNRSSSNADPAMRTRDNVPPTMADASTLSGAALDLLFRKARSHNAWTDAPVAESTLRAVYDLMKLGPTAANGSPARFIFVISPEAKARLRPHLDAANVT